MSYNLTKLLKNVLLKDSHKKIIGYKNNNKWKWKTRKDLTINVIKCIGILKNENVIENDRVIYKGNNSFEWISWNIATNSIGGIWVPLYEDQNDKYVNHIINDCSPKLLISNNKYENVNCISNNCIYRNNNEVDIDFPVYKYPEIANLIYTSGTTGPPKGVILSHKNIISNIEAIDTRFSDLKNKNYTSLNILPWAHIYGFTAELYYNILNGNKIAISSGKENFVKELQEIKPNILYLVPRILDLIKSKVDIFDKPIINILLPKILKYLFGNNIVTIFIGGAQLSEETKKFYLNNNILICEGYGCTETSPMISVNHLSDPRNTDSIGKIMDNIIVKIINDEICVTGPSVMTGYWKNFKATQKSFILDDNKYYYRTGDKGYIKDDFLFYKGRISENYKLSNGKFVSTSDVENIIKKYTKSPFMIYGDNKDYNIIITEKGSDINKNKIEKINKDLEKYLYIKDILYLNKDTFSSHLTPKLSLKRKELIEYNIDIINQIYK